jgi:tetratricopeptide (TPR) repeat protein
LGNFGEAIDIMKQASKYCTKKTGYYVYFSFARVYDQIRDRPNRIICLRKALEYEPTHTIGRHSLGVALSQSGYFDDALRIFDDIINEELAHVDGPSESLVYAYTTKIITLKRAKRDKEAIEALEIATEELEKHESTKYLVSRLDDLVDA